MTFGEVFACFVRNLAALLMTLSQKAKPLENRAIAVVQRIFDQKIGAAIRSLQVAIKALRDVLNAPANRGIIKHINDCAVNIRHRNAGLAALDRFRPEDQFILDMLEREDSTLTLDCPAGN